MKNMRIDIFAAGLAVAVLGAPGEVLYNGIELPSSWPPREFDSLTHEVQRVPYLEKRPDVIPIDVGRQLFVDDFLIERTDLLREWHYPEKHAGNPILWPETALEINRPSNSTARVNCGGIWWDVKRKTFRMWYEAGWLNTAGYAESADGIHWHRVSLDVVPGTNRVLPLGTIRLDGWVVMPDFTKANPYENWLMYVRPPGPRAQPSYVATSKDGFHWSEFRKAGACGDASLVFYNPFRKKWVFSLRSELGPWGRGGSRVRSYREADEFLAGANGDFDISASTRDTVLWLQPDYLEPRDPQIRLMPQLYDVAAVAYESLLVGAFSIWKGPENDKITKSGMPKINDVAFAFSRDGFHFSRLDRTPAIPAERWTSGKWDAGYIRAMPNLLVVNEERLLFYYGACAGNTNRLEIGGFSCDLNGCYDQGASGVAVLRRDGFASMRPGIGLKSGELLTRLVKFSGSHLFVNAALAGGELRVEVLDGQDRVIPGYSYVDCIPITGDRVKVCVMWSGNRNLAALAGRSVRFRFAIDGKKLQCGDLYSFWVSHSSRGESRGYLGGGGPAYAGVCDL